MTALPDWMRPPRVEGWFADDLDHLPEAPRHTELIDGTLVFRMSPQRYWHSRVIAALTYALDAQAPDDIAVVSEMTVRLDERSRPEPDIVASVAPVDDNRTWFAPDEVLLVIELVSPESEHRDRTVKLRKYAEAGIPHFWLIEEEAGTAVVHVYELDKPTGAYVATEVCRATLELPVPFPISIDLTTLVPRKRR
jgi:Uma2 family endonuclease